MPSIEQLLLALKDLQEALATEQAAKAEREAKAEAFLELLASFRGGVTAADLATVTGQLQAHAKRLEAITCSP